MPAARLSGRLLKKEEVENGQRMTKLTRTDGVVGGVDACQVIGSFTSYHFSLFILDFASKYYYHDPNNNTTQPQHWIWVGHENDCATPTTPPHHTNSTLAP